MSAKKSETYKSYQHSPSKSLQIPAKSAHILHGVFWIGSHRLISLPVNQTFTLNCKKFWNEEELALCVTENAVNFLEIFSVNSDKHFLEKVESNYLCLNLTSINSREQNLLGVVRIPLHQFFIAYKDEALTNRLGNSELPVFSTDSWVPILDFNCEKLGEIECTLAVGTEKQINSVKISRHWESQKAMLKKCVIDVVNADFELDYISQTRSKVSQLNAGKDVTQVETDYMLSYVPEILKSSICSESPYSCVTRISERENTIAETIRIYMVIKKARDLPNSPPLNHISKQSTANKEKHIRFSPGEEPNTYVTFQANVSGSSMVKSHEGMVYTTSIIGKSSNPTWNESFQFSLKLDYFMNKNKRFILKVWRKSSSLSGSQNVPAPLEDSIIGFVTIDLTTFQKNAYISDWFNIMNYFGQTNGQLMLTAQCLDELRPIEHLSNVPDNQVDHLLDSFQAGLSINNFNLSRAIKRKFTELEEISQRLRIRLLDVTNNTEYTNELESTDEYMQEFEHDLNTVVYEDDCEIDFSKNGHGIGILGNPDNT